MTLAEQWKQEGYQKGIEKGVEKGIEKGKAEALYNTSVNLFKLGIDAEQIAQATGLPLQKIKELWGKKVS
ncbi:MAG: hypothetical protein JSR85_06000 [Proteobacteria bacterium]|nr:hypothetical protein [Pseudomonadota bacterium]